MASTISKVPLLRAAAIRGYSTQTHPIAGTSNYEIKTTVLPNKLVVASAENESAISRISIAFRAGSRNETGDNLGAAHVLRIAAGCSTKNISQFAIARQLPQLGANLTCTTDREIIAYTLEGTRQAIEKSIPFLTAVATQQVLKPWEVADNNNRLKLELATRPPQLRAVDLLHKAAYRTGLGNSIYIAKYNIGKLSSETLQHYIASNFTSNRAAVVGIGVDHGELVQYAKTLELEGGSDAVGSGTYKGGEIRSDKGGDMAFVAIAGQGGALKNQKEALAFAILQRAFGMGPSTKFGLESSSVLRKTVGILDEPHSIAALNVSYSDSGLFGVLTASSANIAGKLVTSAVKVLKSGSVSDSDVSRGKNQLKIDLLSAMESGATAVGNIGRQAALVSCADSPSKLADAVDSITPADVNSAAKKVAGSKLTIAAVGNLSTVPFLDEIK